MKKSIIFVIQFLLFISISIAKENPIKNQQPTEEEKKRIKEKIIKALNNGAAKVQVKTETKVVGSPKKNITRKIGKKEFFLTINTTNKTLQSLVDKYNLLLMEKRLNLFENFDDNEKKLFKENNLRIKKNLLQKKVENISLSNKILEKENLEQKRLLEVRREKFKNFRKEKIIKEKFIRTKQVEYTTTPFDKERGLLKVSDRVIKMPTVIWFGVGEYITKKINFYANQNSFPIFLIIDTCYGGLVNEGSLIMKAVENSKVPVYVVVRTLAASMAAIITTRAKYSFVYPNSIILHHQIMNGVEGNATEQKDNIKRLEKLSKIIYDPIIKKMNVKSIRNVKDFIREMYKNSIDGDWIEFGEDAVNKYNWANKIVSYIDIYNDGVEEEKKNFQRRKRVMIVDQSGSISLSNPLNHLYYLYNPNNRFKIKNN